MQQSSGLAGLLQENLDRVFDRQRAELADLGPDVVPLLAQAQEFLTGGKRLRAQFAITGYQCVAASIDPMAEAVPEHVLHAATALELFHAAALIHDDIIDQSATRRGRPSVHSWFSALHRDSGWRSNSDRYGIAAAILVGDLLQSWADESFALALTSLTPAVANRARAHFNRMRTEVAAGQYLDILEEQMGVLGSETDQLERATRVLVYKSAKYSVEAPLLIGASLASANDTQEQALSDFGLPIGVAFQLRDDLLGVFGDSAVTGKPSGDDLREGKRTVLVGLTRQHLPSSARRVFDELLGDPNLNDEQIDMLQRTMRESGAVASVEGMIEANLTRALTSLDEAQFNTSAVGHLKKLAERAIDRTS